MPGASPLKYPEIKINKKTSRFFIAICKQGIHSFVMLGVYEDLQVKELLCRVGKWAWIEGRTNICSILFQLFFGKVKAGLAGEYFSVHSKVEKDINYQAYDISYNQYLEFVAILCSLETNHQLACYQPKSESGDEVTMVFSDVARSSDTRVDLIQKSSESLNMSNTCRHTGIALVEGVLHEKLSKHISTSYIFNLPYKTKLKEGIPSMDIPFYVLPPTPNTYPDLELKKRNVLNKLYQRMEEMLLLRPDSLQTQKKFNLLKNLYLDVVGPQKDVPLDQLLFNIQQWKDHNKSLLSKLRQEFVWDFFWTGRKAASLRLIEEIEEDLGNEPRPCHPFKY